MHMLGKQSRYFCIFKIAFSIILVLIYCLFKYYIIPREKRIFEKNMSLDELEDYYDAKLGCKALKEHYATRQKTLSIDDVMKQWRVK